MPHERYEWLPEGDPDVRSLRDGVQEGGPGLYLVWCPIRWRKVLIEAYEPWELRLPDYRKPQREFVGFGHPGGPVVTMSEALDPYRYTDFRLGRLVAIGERAVLEGPSGWLVPDGGRPMPGGSSFPTRLDTRLLTVLRRNNRAARDRYERKAHGSSARERFREGLDDLEDAKEAAADARYDELANEFARDMVYALTPKIAVPDHVERST